MYITGKCAAVNFGLWTKGGDNTNLFQWYDFVIFTC